jgi:hypothetical protein
MSQYLYCAAAAVLMGGNSNVIEMCALSCVFTVYVGATILIKWLAKIMTVSEVMVTNID